jgi:hypothetical protein
MKTIVERCAILLNRAVRVTISDPSAVWFQESGLVLQSSLNRSPARAERKAAVDITIKRRKFDLRCEYDINAPEGNYYAVKSFWPRGGLKVLSLDRKQTFARIKSRSFFKVRFDFLLSSDAPYRFSRVNLWKGVFVCERAQEHYTLYTHKGLNYSIFRAEDQVAAFSKNRFVIGGGDRYEIHANSDEDALLMICIVLVVDVLDGADHETVTIDLGNVGPEARRFDESWEPD